MLSFPEDLQNYLKQTQPHSPRLLSALQKETLSRMPYGHMICGPLVGQFLSLLIQIHRPKRVLEVGMFTGYSTLWMASALCKEGRIDTCEINPEAEFLAKKYFKKSALDHKIRVHMGPALQTLPQLSSTFDFIFLDGDKLHYPTYYEHLLAKLTPGGLLVVDNCLWWGRVGESKDPRTDAIHQLNLTVAQDPRVSSTLLTIGDGLQLIRKL